MPLRTWAALLGAIGVVLAVPPREGRGLASSPGNSSIDSIPTGFEVVIVYATATEACPATPTECPADVSTVESSESASTSTAQGGWNALKASPSPSATWTFAHEGPIETLPPSVHWSYDTKPAENVIPIPVGKGSNMYYGVSDPTQSGHFALLTYFFNKPSVNLDHCDHTSVVEYTSDGLTIRFMTHEAYNYALNTWVADEEIILITYTEGCGDYDKGDRCYFKVSSLVFQDGGFSVIAKGKPCHPDDIIDHGETEWGWWIPRHGGQGPSATSTSRASTSTGGGASFSWSGSSSTSATVPVLTATTSQPGTSASSTPPSGSDGDETSGFGASKSACIPPVDAKYGLPTACFGDAFDLDLDDDLGWEAMSQEYMDFITSMAPGIDESTVPTDAESWDDFVMRKRAIRRRWSLIGAIVDTVVKPFVAVKTAVQNTLSISGSVNKDVSWKIPDPTSSNDDAKKLKDPGAKQVASPWGSDSILLKAFGTQDPNNNKALNSYLNVFCVGCGVSGNAKLAGSAKWTPLGGFLEGAVEVNADVQFVLKIGIDAQMTYKQDFKSDLFDVGLPGLSYGVVTIGPRISVGTRVTLEAEAKGKILAGAEMGLQNAHVRIDFVNPSQTSKDGWDPYFKPVFEAEGELMLSAELGLPIGLKCGLQISTWDKSVGIIDEPSIKGVAQVAAAIGLTESNTFSAGFKDTDGCTGIATQLSWRNKLYIDIFGTQQIPLLDTNDKTLARGCIALPALPAPPAASDAPESSGPSDSDSSDSTGSGSSDSGSTDSGSSDAGSSGSSDSSGSDSSDSSDAGSSDAGSSDSGSSDSSGSDSSDSTGTGSAGSSESESSSSDSGVVRRVALSSATQTAATASSLASSATSSLPTGSNSNQTVVDITSKIKPSSNTSSLLDYTTQPLPNRPYNDTNGYEYSLLVDPDATIMVVSCSNGNLYPFSVNGSDNPSCSEMWATHSDVLVADGSQRLAHYYNNTMSVLGVSRLRVEDEADIPTGGVVVGFAPYSYDGNYDDGSYFYLAVDPHGAVFYLMACQYEDPSLGAKIFLARDPDEGAALLKSEDVQYTVTGGKVTDCSPLMLMEGKYDDSDNYLSYTEAQDSAPWDLDDDWSE